jgi:prepilin-type N-terminal cleavage/methylation domain-containing protein
MAMVRLIRRFIYQHMYLTNNMKLKNNKGFTLIEMFVVTAIFTVIVGGMYLTLNTGRTTWQRTDAQMQLETDLRQVLEKMSRELRESGSDQNGTMQLTIEDGAGKANSDIVRFSIPVVCKSGTSVIDANGNVAHWGAPLTWGCSSSSCMDADNDCSTVDYKYVEYRIDNSYQLVRRILNGALTLIRTDVFAVNVTDMQGSLSTDSNIVTLTITASGVTHLHLPITISRTQEIHLRNRG